MSIKEQIRTQLRRRNIEVSGYRHTLPARRQRLFDRFGIEVLVDVGANVGQYASEARRAGYRGRLVSYEPLAGPYSQLSARASVDSLWETERTAVGAERGTLTLKVSENSIFSSALPILGQSQEASPDSRQVADEEVPVARLDDLLDASSARTAVKIDVQGFERAVLDGARESLPRVTLVEIEMAPRPVYEGQVLMPEVLDRMSAAGLTLALTENLFPDPATGRALQFNGLFVRLDD